MAWFDFTSEGIVEVGLEAKMVGDIQGVEPVDVEIDQQHYIEENLLPKIGEVALVNADAA